MRVFVTGGSGFIGSRLVQTLVASGHQAVCLSRSGETSARLAELGAEVLSGDFLSPDTVRGCLHEARPTHVAHLAAEIATQRNKERIDKINVRGTETLVAACRDLDIERFLFLSTVVRGKANGEIFCEDDVIPATTAYGKSKQAGDEIVMHANREWDLPAIILRPSHVYGAGGWFAELLADSGFRIPGKGDNLWDMVHVDDVVSACMLVLEKAPAGSIYHVCDDQPIVMNDFFARVAEALGRKPYGHAPVWLAKALRGSGPIVAAVRSARSSNARLKELGWTPRYPNSADAIPDVVKALANPA
jgi:nucleoside-diphosphate-sugar epimerase